MAYTLVLCLLHKTYSASWSTRVLTKWLHSFLSLFNTLHLRLTRQHDTLDPDQRRAILPTILACEDARLYVSERLGAMVCGVDAGFSKSTERERQY
jgi:hypothetical protein